MCFENVLGCTWMCLKLQRLKDLKIKRAIIIIRPAHGPRGVLHVCVFVCAVYVCAVFVCAVFVFSL